MKNRKLTVTIFVSYTYPFIGSGIGNVALHQAEYLAKRGHTVTIVSSNVPETARDFTRNGVRFVKLSAWNVLYALHVPVPLFLFTGSVVSLIRRSDIVHVHDMLYPSSFLAVVFTKLYGKPVVLTQHIPFIRYKSAALNLAQQLAFFSIGRYVLRASARIIYFNSEIGIWLKRYRSRMTFLPNGVDTSFFRPAPPRSVSVLRKKYRLPAKKPIVLFVGRLVPKKGYDLLYQARNRAYCLVFVGGGDIPPAMKHDPDVLFLGARSPGELRDLYQASDVFILPSREEGFPLSVQEAMASGLAVIVSDLQCYDDLRLNRTLVRRTPASVRGIHTSIMNILSKPELRKRMQRYSLRMSSQTYTWDNHVDRLIQLYRKVLS